MWACLHSILWEKNLPWWFCKGLWCHFPHWQRYAQNACEFLNKETSWGMKQHQHTYLPTFLTSLYPPLLLCSYGDRVEHFRVLEGGGQYCIWDESFCSLNRLVDFYRTHSIAVEKVVCLRDPPSSPRLLSHPQCNPYPNPYKSSSQESLPSPRLYAHPSRPERETSQHLLEPVLGVW